MNNNIGFESKEKLDIKTDSASGASSLSNLESSEENSDLSPKERGKLLNNEMRSFKNRGFHDGYDKGKETTIQESFDTGYKKAFELNFILSTLRGVANALKSSNNLKRQTTIYNQKNHNVVNLRISENHLYLLESMKFDGTTDVESLKGDLIKICRENRLEILAHYVSQVG